MRKLEIIFSVFVFAVFCIRQFLSKEYVSSLQKKDVIFLKMKTTNKESTQGKKTTAGNSGW